MVAITPALLTSLSILGMVQSAIANSATEADSLAVVRGISDTVSEEIYHDKRATGKLPKPIRKAGQAAIKVGKKLPSPVKKQIKAAATGAEKKVVKAAISASSAKNKIKKKLGKRDLEELEVYYNTRATGKLPKPIRKAGQAAIKVGKKLPSPVKKQLKAAATGAEKKVVKAAIGASKVKNSIKKKLGKKDLESDDIEILVSRDVISDLIARSVAENWDSEIYYDKRATGKLPKPIRKAGLAAIKVGKKLPSPVKKQLKAAATGAEKKVVKAAIGASKAKNSIKKKLGGKRDLGEDYDVEVRDFDDEVSWE
ncbi:unnamed protein product [Clonostachys chloroleuca]|uniref:Uncharacterized protein n=1 Tax=Clonostachys chloroleuca TaxID=1926264 RepID=A0AA35QCM1_9HYPO|nr:unnamed protein product [Clonostachys chloroleuca]